MPLRYRSMLVLVPLASVCLAAVAGAQQPAAPPPAPPAPAQPAPSAPAVANAADLYRQAWSDTFSEAVFDDGYILADFKEEASWMPSAVVASQLAGAQPGILTLLKAVKVDPCDWGVAYDQGYDARVPHLSKLRVSARVLIADARRLIAKGDTQSVEDGVDRVAALILLSRHVKNDRLTLSSRTGQSLAAMGLGEGMRLARDNKLTEKTRKVLLDALHVIDTPDPCGLKDAVANEPVMLRTTIKRTCTGPSAAAMFWTKIGSKANTDVRARSGIDQMDGAAILRAVDSVDTMYREVLAAWDAPDAVQQIKAIETQKNDGGYGGVAVAVPTELQHNRVVLMRFRSLVAEAIRTISGQPAPVAPPPAAPGTAPPASGK